MIDRTNRRQGLLVVFAIAALWSPDAAVSQTLPFDTLADWNFYNTSGWLAYRRGDFVRAGQSFRLSIESLQPYGAVQPNLLARSYTDYSRVLVQQKRYADAEPLARWALSVREKSPGNRSESLRQNLDLMVKISKAQGHWNESVDFLKQELALQESLLGPGNAELVATIDELIDVYVNQGNLSEAEPLFRRSQAIREATSEASLKNADRLEEQADTMARLAGAGVGGLQTRIRIDNNIATMRETAVQAREATVDSISSAVSTEHFATLLRKTGRIQEADSLAVKAKGMRDAAETRAANLRAGR